MWKTLVGNIYYIKDVSGVVILPQIYLTVTVMGCIAQGDPYIDTIIDLLYILI
jgi:hypothetical protein